MIKFTEIEKMSKIQNIKGYYPINWFRYSLRTSLQIYSWQEQKAPPRKQMFVHLFDSEIGIKNNEWTILFTHFPFLDAQNNHRFGEFRTDKKKLQKIFALSIEPS